MMLQLNLLKLQCDILNLAWNIFDNWMVEDGISFVRHCKVKNCLQVYGTQIKDKVIPNIFCRFNADYNHLKMKDMEYRPNPCSVSFNNSKL